MKEILNSWKTYIDQYVKRFEENVLLDWNILTVPHSIQKDSYNCGIYCLIFTEKHLQNDFESMKRLSFNDLGEMRKKVAQQLMLYEVFLTGCCPKCGFELGEEQGIECCKCKRTYHFKPFCTCVERDLEDSSTYFTCRLCQINFWDNEHGIQEKCIPKVPKDGLTTIELEENGNCSTQEVISNQEFDELPVPQQCLSHKDLHEQECFSTYSSKEESKEVRYFLRKSPKKKRKRASFFYPDIRPKKVHLEGEMAEHADEEVSSDVLGYKYDEQRFSDAGDSFPAEVVDLYLSLKCKQWKEKNVHFLASEIVTSIFCSVCDPVHKYLLSTDIQNYDILIGALHEGGCHWTLVAIFPNESKVLYVDPHGESEQTKNLYRKQWLNFMTERYNQSIGPYLGENWSVVSIDHQKQSDSHSSGVFILKFADIILSRNGNLDIYFEKVFKDNNGIKAFRMEIGQYLVKCSVDKIQHISESHEESDRKMYDMLGRVCIIPDDEAKENDKDDALSECLLRKEINPDMFPNSLPDIIYEDMKDYLYGIIECESTQCKLESHKRHHKFLQSPLQVCNVERACFGFGCEVIHEETIKYLEVKMNIDLVHYPVDPSKPLRVKKGTIRNVQNKKLSKIFSLYWLVEIYVTGVLLKEAIIYVHMKNTKKNYSICEEECTVSEINKAEELKKLQRK